MTEKRALKSIKEIKQELTDSSYVSSIALTDVKSSMSHKHHASVKLNHSIKCALASLIYKSTSLYKLWDFMLDYEVYFNAVEENEIC